MRLLGLGHRFAAVDDDLLVQTGFDVAVFEAFPGRDAGFVGVDFEDADAAVEVAVACVAAEAGAAGVAHPHCFCHGFGCVAY